MTLSPVPVESFGGLNLVDDPGTVGWGASLDALNVALDYPGRVRSRDGWSPFTASAAAAAYTILAKTHNGGVLGTRGSSVDAINPGTGAVTATTVKTMYAAAVLGTPSADSTYLAAGTDTLVKWSGAAFSTPTVTVDGTSGRLLPSGFCIGVTPWDNRLVVGNSSQGPNAVTSSADYLWFSDPGDATSWSSNNFIELSPGDGEGITGIVVWRELLFVFRRTKFFVFYGTSTDATGNPIFSYRTVDTGEGQDFVAGGSVAGTDGVYFSNTRGIWRTTGGPPEKVSGPIDPLFGLLTAPAAYVGPTFASAGGALIAWHEGKLYATNPVSACTAVWYPDRGWAVWDVGAYMFLGIEGSNATTSKLLFSVLGGVKHIAKLSPSYTTDNGAAITSRYRSGFADLGSTAIKTIREWRLEGSGSPTFKTSHDFGSLETGAAVTLGVSPAVLEARRRYATRGRHFSWQVGGTTAWSLNSLVANVREQRAAGVHSAT